MNNKVFKLFAFPGWTITWASQWFHRKYYVTIKYWKKNEKLKGNINIKVILKAIDRYLKSGVLKSIVHVIKYADFQLYRVHPDGVIKKIWQLTINL